MFAIDILMLFDYDIDTVIRKVVFILFYIPLPSPHLTTSPLLALFFFVVFVFFDHFVSLDGFLNVYAE